MSPYILINFLIVLVMIKLSRAFLRTADVAFSADLFMHAVLLLNRGSII